MNKEIIYIDTEDDITAIIGKIKASKDEIIALVPPKRTGILQSAVNLRLLARTAKSNKKELSIITNSKALSSLAASAKIPVAKNLQSDPEIAEITALDVDDGEDIIDGTQLPVGDLAKTAKESSAKKPKSVSESKGISDAIDDIESSDIFGDRSSTIKISSSVPLQDEQKKDKDKKIPNFSKFRKKLFIIIGIILLSVGFLVWAIIFAPAATVIINAKTDDADISKTITLAGSTTATDLDKNIIQSITKTETDDVSVEFTATGSSTVGTKATGSVVFSNCDSSTSETISSGTYISSGGKNYVTQADITVGGADFKSGVCSTAGTSSSVSVAAADIGSSYNTASGVSFTVSGYSSAMTATTSNGITGGESHAATVVSSDDINTAKTTLAKEITTKGNTVKKTLTSQFTNGESVIADSFVSESKDATPSIAVGKEATSKVTLTSSTTFSITAIAKTELESFLKNELNKQIGDATDRKIYSDGFDDVVFSGYVKSDSTATVNVATTGKIGPKIDENSIKEKVKGKNYGDAQSLIEGIDGVNSVDVKFSFFWVNKIPDDTSKISVKFALEDD